MIIGEVSYLVFITFNEFFHLLLEFSSFLSQKSFKILHLIRGIAFQRLDASIEFLDCLFKPLNFTQLIRVVFVICVLESCKLQSKQFVLLLKLFDFVFENIDFCIFLGKLALIEASHGIKLSIFQ